jgi:hypothetical protein
MPRIEAITRTAEARIRPVLLTTITTMAGLAPMMFGISLDFANGGYTVDSPTALWWKQLATAVVFGLGIATVLTLVVTPSLWRCGSGGHDPRLDRPRARAHGRRPRQPHRAGLGARPRRAADPRPGDLLGRGPAAGGRQRQPQAPPARRGVIPAARGPLLGRARRFRAENPAPPSSFEKSAGEREGLAPHSRP